MGRVHARDGVPITYGVSKIEFEKKYIPVVVHDKKATKFVQLIQGQMIVVEYIPDVVPLHSIDHWH